MSKLYGAIAHQAATPQERAAFFNHCFHAWIIRVDHGRGAKPQWALYTGTDASLPTGFHDETFSTRRAAVDEMRRRYPNLAHHLQDAAGVHHLTYYPAPFVREAGGN